MAQVVQLTPRRMVPVHRAVQELSDDAATVLFKARKYKAAIAMGKRAIAATPNSRELWTNLATYYWHDGQHAEALACAERACRIDITYSLAHLDRALSLESLGRNEEADDAFDTALNCASGSKHVEGIKWNHALFLLATGRLDEGFAEYEVRIKHRTNPDGTPVYGTFAKPYWQGEPLAGKRIAIVSEQGIGDTILFSRYIPWIVGQCEKAYLCTRHDVARLMWGFNDIATFFPDGVAIPPVDYMVAMGSLPHYYQKQAGFVVVPDPGIISKRVTQVAEGEPFEVPEPGYPDAIKVGICWSGNPDMERNEERSVPLDMLVDLASDPRVFLYGLQAGPARNDIYKFGFEQLVLDMGDRLMRSGLASLGHALRQMDVVVTACTSVAHLAGALGIPAIVMLCKTPYWVWMQDRADSPWYPSLKLIRQSKYGDWTSVIEGVRHELNLIQRNKEQNHG
jgi:hypothetical protein